MVDKSSFLLINVTPLWRDYDRQILNNPSLINSCVILINLAIESCFNNKPPTGGLIVIIQLNWLRKQLMGASQCFDCF